MGMDGYMKGVFLMGGMAQPRQRIQPVSDNHDEVIELLKEKRAWRNYAASVQKALDAERQAEAEVIKALQEVSPEHPLASPEAVKELQQKIVKAIPSEAAFQKADEVVKQFL